MKRKENIIFVGGLGFPFGSAAVQRRIQLANALSYAGFKVCVLNRRGSHSKAIVKREKIKSRGKHNDINYIYASFLSYKPTNFINRNVFKIIGEIIEPLIILYYRIFKATKHMVVTTMYMDRVKNYRLLSKLLGIKIVYDYVELVESVNNRDVTVLKLSEKSFDNQFVNYIDKLIVISTYLENHVLSLGKNNLPMIKIPPMIDFSLMDSVQSESELKKYFLFCGSAAYKDVILFIIDAYKKIETVNGVTLKLVINGTKDQINQIKDYVSTNGLDGAVEILSNLTYESLISLYKSSLALLIPLTDNIQDQARFPFKICEYVASKRPIITTNVSLINEYFKDKETALLVNLDDVDDFSKKMVLLINDTNLADKIGEKAYKMGKEKFNYKSYSSSLLELIKN